MPIRNNCINFYKIVNYRVVKGDSYTYKLISYYKRVVLGCKYNDLKVFDSVIYRYLYDYRFRAYFQNVINDFNYDEICLLVDKYYDNTVKSFESTIWI